MERVIGELQPDLPDSRIDLDLLEHISPIAWDNVLSMSNTPSTGVSFVRLSVHFHSILPAILSVLPVTPRRGMPPSSIPHAD